MKRTVIGTRFTTGCGHSWKRRHPRWTVRQLAGNTSDCAVCGELLAVPEEQFSDPKALVFPADVHMPLFHVWMHERDSRWPADGANTGWIEFPTGA